MCTGRGPASLGDGSTLRPRAESTQRMAAMAVSAAVRAARAANELKQRTGAACSGGLRKRHSDSGWALQRLNDWAPRMRIVSASLMVCVRSDSLVLRGRWVCHVTVIHRACVRVQLYNVGNDRNARADRRAGVGRAHSSCILSCNPTYTFTSNDIFNRFIRYRNYWILSAGLLP